MTASVTIDRRPADTMPVAQPLLSVDNLTVEFHSSRGHVRAVDDVSWAVAPGEIVAIVGESGCGKSATAMALMRLLPRPAGRVTGGTVTFDGKDLMALSPDEMRQLRGRDIGMVFQEPMTSLNPALTIGDQITEPLFSHFNMSTQEARARALELLALVGIGDGERRLSQYPHHLSGGMRQRVLIAMALACDPKLIIADEPTTALDVTIQAQILELMRDLVQRLGISLVIITHNLGIVARYVDRVHVMYAGRIVESGPVEVIFAAPKHPYTFGLISSVPNLRGGRVEKLSTIEGLPPDMSRLPSGCRFAPRCCERIARCDTESQLALVGEEHSARCWRADEPRVAEAGAASLVVRAADPALPEELAVDTLRKHFALGGGQVAKAVENVSFAVPRGQTLGLVGESGCGKSTIGRMVLQLEEPSAGSIVFEGRTIAGNRVKPDRSLWKNIQVVFQDPFSSLNPRMTVRQIIAEPIRVHNILPRGGRDAVEARVQELLALTGLLPVMADRFPHQLSGGQRQRVGIARALAHEPDFIVLDEPVSALDVSIQGQIINLLDELQTRLGLGYLFIAHDLAVVRHLSHRVAVMYLGRIMEMGDCDALFDAPLHPYTRALLDAVPVPDPAVERLREPNVIKGELPSPLSPPSGCVFRTRCPMAIAECAATVPPLEEKQPGKFAACIRI
ncbi:MAG TPA: ABC transporter ATP-binding protein [Rhizobiaceae bacterium]|nr:ABC transporter ATP-binding protein [Rhizobiaceae bacterium]